MVRRPVLGPWSRRLRLVGIRADRHHEACDRREHGEQKRAVRHDAQPERPRRLGSGGFQWMGVGLGHGLISPPRSLWMDPHRHGRGDVLGFPLTHPLADTNLSCRRTRLDAEVLACRSSSSCGTRAARVADKRRLVELRTRESSDLFPHPSSSASRREVRGRTVARRWRRSQKSPSRPERRADRIRERTTTAPRRFSSAAVAAYSAAGPAGQPDGEEKRARPTDRLGRNRTTRRSPRSWIRVPFRGRRDVHPGLS